MTYVRLCRGQVLQRKEGGVGRVIRVHRQGRDIASALHQRQIRRSNDIIYALRSEHVHIYVCQISKRYGESALYEQFRFEQFCCEKFRFGTAMIVNIFILKQSFHGAQINSIVNIQALFDILDHHKPQTEVKIQLSTTKAVHFSKQPFFPIFSKNPLFKSIRCNFQNWKIMVS